MTGKAARKAVGRPFAKGDPRINRTKPGTGAPPSELRAKMRGSLADRIAIAEGIADSEAASDADRLRAVDLLAKYGLGTMKEVSVENVRERVSKTLDVIRARCSPEQAQAILAELRPVWA